MARLPNGLLSTLPSGLRGLGSTPGRGQCQLWSWARHLSLIMSFSTQVLGTGYQ